MTATLQVLFYTDALEFGGHEAMTAFGIESLVSRKDQRVCVMYYPGNERFREKMEALSVRNPNLTLLKLERHTASLQTLRSIASVRYVRRISTMMADLKPDVVVVSQGRIDVGTTGLLASSRAGLRTISYIPMAHPVSVSGKPVAVWMRDRINRFFYSIPDKFITISDGCRRMLLAHGVNTEIAVVPNCIETIDRRESDRQEFRRCYSLREEDCVVGIIGRFIFRQKAQDFVVNTIARFQELLHGFAFVFVGEGRDEAALRRMVFEKGLGRTARILPWISSPAQIYSGLDIVLIPSNFEGVPLVMLEAMSCGLPIVGSDVDGMSDCLPREWLFPRGDSAELVNTLLRVKDQHAPELLEKNRRCVLDECSVAKFGLRFTNAVLGKHSIDEEEVCSQPTLVKSHVR